MADYAIHDTTLTGISNVIRKKEGSSALIDPADYADRINLMGMLEEKTVSSSPIVTFSDGADAVPLKKCEITLPASLDGYSEIDVVSAGKNLVDGYIDYSATNKIVEPQFYKVGTYTFSCVRATNINGIYVRKGSVIDLTAESISTKFNTLTNTFTVSEEGYYFIQIYRSTSSPTWEDEPLSNVMVEVGSTATTFEPFDGDTHTATLGRTIYGGKPDVVAGQGESAFAKGSKALSDFTVGATVGDYTAYTYAGFMTETVNNNNKQICYIGTTQIPYIYQGIGANTTHFYIGTNGQINLYLPNDWGDFSHDVEAVAELATPETFTFDPVPIDSKLGNNTMWSEQGSSAEVTYRGQGTVTVYPNAEEASF